MAPKIGGGTMLTANKIDTSREILRTKDALRDDRVGFEPNLPYVMNKSR